MIIVRSSSLKTLFVRLISVEFLDQFLAFYFQQIRSWQKLVVFILPEFLSCPISQMIKYHIHLHPSYLLIVCPFHLPDPLPLIRTSSPLISVCSTFVYCWPLTIETLISWQHFPLFSINRFDICFQTYTKKFWSLQMLS